MFSLASEAQKVKMKNVTGVTKQAEGIGEMPALKDKMLPKFIVSDIYGKTYNTDELKGKVVVLNFWFIACKPCIMEIPDLNKLVENYKNTDVVFIALALNATSEIKSLLEENPFAYDIVPDAKDLANLLGVKGYPTHIIVDKKGKMVHSALGLSNTSVQTVKTVFDGLLK